MPAPMKDQDALLQAHIDATYLSERIGSNVAVGAYAGVSDTTVARALRGDTLTRSTAAKLREAAERLEREAQIVPREKQKIIEEVRTQSNGGTKGVMPNVSEAMRHFDKAFDALLRASESAMPISRPGFQHVIREMQKLLNEYIAPLNR